MLDPEAASKVMARMRDQANRKDPLAGLTPQERKILELIGEGLTNRQIGERMYLAEKTVKNYISALFAKLGHGAPDPGGRLRNPSLRPGQALAQAGVPVVNGPVAGAVGP